MIGSQPRTALSCCLLGILIALSLTSIQAQEAKKKKTAVPPPAPTTETPRFDFNPPSSFITLPSDPNLKKRFDAIPDYIDEELWPAAVRSLQGLLDIKEDVFVPMSRRLPDGKEVMQWRSVRAEANRLLGALPRHARESYEVSFGPQARELLAEARRQNDPHLLAEVAQRYFYTEAGAEATRTLGAYHLDRGRYLTAALCFEKLLERNGVEKLPPLDLYRAALAFHRSGDPSNVEKTWKQLTARAGDELDLGGRKVKVAELEKALGQPGEPTFDQGPAREWTMFRGTPGRSGVGKGGLPASEARWSLPLTRDRTVAAWLQDASRLQAARAQPVLPGAFPVVAAGRVVFRSHFGLMAVDVRTGERLWESTSSRSLEQLAREATHRPYISEWVAAHLQNSPNALLENSVLGTLSTDGSLVYAVDDLAVPPLPNSYQGFAGRQGDGLNLAFAAKMTDMAYHSRMYAVDLDTGKAVWETGQRTPKDRAGKQPPAAPLDDCFFLGPPLPLAGRLYALVERNSELRLVCLSAANGEAVWTQLLAVPQKNVLLDSARRVHAAHLACGEGILVCPTNAGALVGVDLLTHSLLWAHLYRDEPPRVEPPARRVPVRIAAGAVKPPSCIADWKASAPLIHEGKVVYGAPDAPAIQCLSLRDGTPLWKVHRGDGDQYLAGVHKGKVLLVGKRECRALDLADGKEQWKVETGLPCGKGVASGGVYYLAVKSTDAAQEPAILALDMEKGVLLGRTPSPGTLPGNLLFYEGEVLSQTVTDVSAFPPRAGE